MSKLAWFLMYYEVLCIITGDDFDAMTRIAVR